jgi:hypothetical protein
VDSDDPCDEEPSSPGPQIANSRGPGARLQTVGKRSTLKTIDRPLLFLVAAALVLYVPGMSWGIPHATGPDRLHAWGNDDQVPLPPLTELHASLTEPGPGRNVAYPYFHYLLVGAAYTPYLGYLYATGKMSSVSGVYPFGLTDPVASFTMLTWIGRFVTLILALGVVVSAYITGRALQDRLLGTIAGAFAMVMFPMTYYAKSGNLDVPVLAWTSMAIAVGILVVTSGMTVKRAVLLGGFIALAGATKDQAAGSFFLFMPVVLWHHWRSRTVHRLGRWEGVWAAPAAGAAAAVGTFVLASGIPLDPRRFIDHLTLARSVGTGSSGLFDRHAATLSGYAAQVTDILFNLADMLSPLIFILAAVGTGVALRKRHPSALLLLSSIGFVVMILPVRLTRIHHTFPIAWPLTILAAYAVWAGIKRGGRTRTVSTVFGGLATVLALLPSLDIAHAMIWDSRYDAQEWLDERLVPGDVVLFFGAPLKNPYFAAETETIAIDQPDNAASTIRERRPEYIIAMPEDTDELRNRVEWREGPLSVRNAYVPAPLFAALADGSLGYRLAARFQTPRLLPWSYRPHLSYATVNPPIHLFARTDLAGDAPALEPWSTAPHNPPVYRVNEPPPRPRG